MHAPLLLEKHAQSPEKAMCLLLCFIADVATTIRLNTPYYQGTPMPTETPSNVLWLSEILAGMNKLSKALTQDNTADVRREIDSLAHYWTHYQDEIESAQKNTAGDNMSWHIEDGLNILNLLKSTHGTPTN